MVQEFVDEIKKLIDDTLNGVHTAMPGTISGASGMTATVKPSVTFKTADGKSIFGGYCRQPGSEDGRGDHLQ